MNYEFTHFTSPTDQYPVQPYELPSSYYPAKESFIGAPPLRIDNIDPSTRNFLNRINTARSANLDLNQGIGVDTDYAYRTVQNMDRTYGFQADGSNQQNIYRRDVGQYLPEVSLQSQLQQEVLRMAHQSPTERHLSSGNMGNIDPNRWHFPISQSKANSVTRLNSDGRASILTPGIPNKDILYGRNQSSASTDFFGSQPIVGGAELILGNRVESFEQPKKCGQIEGCGCGCGCGMKYDGRCKCPCKMCQKNRATNKEGFLDGEEGELLNLFEEKNIIKLFVVLIFVALVLQYCEIAKLNGMLRELSQKHSSEPINPITEASASEP